MVAHIEIGIDCREPETLGAFWSEALGYTLGDLDRAGIYLDLVPPSPDWPVVYFQKVPEQKSVKNRVHLDLWENDPQAVVDRLVARNAKKIGDPQTGSEGGWWQVMADPEGNEFCVCRADSSEVVS